MASLTGSTTDEGDTLRQLIYPTMRSRSNKHNTSLRAEDVTEKRKQNEVVSFFMYRQNRQNHRSFARRQVSARKLESKIPGLKDRGEIFRKRQEDFESETDSEESQDDEGDLDGDGVDTSGDESAGEEEEQPKPAASSSGITPTGNSPIETIKPGIDSPAALVSGAINSLPSANTSPIETGGIDSPTALGSGIISPLPPTNTSPIETVKPGIDSPKISHSGTINPSPTNSANSSPFKGGFDSNPTHLAVLITGIVVVVVFIIFLATCVMIRSKKHRQPGGLYSRYQGLRRNLALASQDIPVSGYQKAPVIDKAIMKATSKPYWDPESGFSKPYTSSVRSKLHNTEEKHTSVFRKALSGAKSSIPHIKSRPKSLVLRSHNSAFGLPKIVQVHKEIQPLAKAHTVGSHSSSNLFAKGHENGEAQDILPPGFTSKFSWTNSSSTNTHARSSIHTPKALHYTPRVDESDAATVLTEDTEPVRFRSTTSWVLQQQAKSQHHAQLNPDKPKRPPSDIGFSISEDSHAPTGALPGLAI
ncbi:hypothetical protein ACJ73_03513 [Blastomyces percursus]|uniref:Uncharacterized protein n=1 Tax=Blastomyces percursus TaxID=1658174 RepID=A0A1J9QY36_9EURO|nr:hypothetical protein ACJ73_03513 [Blastomyces percursus]